MITPLLELVDVSRSFAVGEGQSKVDVLQHIDLRIDAGELVAIIGASGSGKSTLLNILGCIDRPSAGRYRVAGQEMGTADSDTLARLRHEHFGFIFQRYNLLAHLSAEENVALPAVYAGEPKALRIDRARALLRRFGLAERCNFLPSQLSGGQQQRTSIARALMNGGKVILADEPTGALDSASGKEVMQALQTLNQQGYTVIVVTHDPEVASYARRVIEISDGKIVSDHIRAPRPDNQQVLEAAIPTIRTSAGSARLAMVAQHLEAWRMAWLTMRTHRLRTALTMLGILIGIASVQSSMAIGQAARNKVLEDIRNMGTNTITIYPGKGWGDIMAGQVKTLMITDVEALRGQPYIDSITPIVKSSVTVRVGNVGLNALVMGVGDLYFRVHGFKSSKGQLIHEEHVRTRAQVAVIDDKAAEQLFGKRSAIGQILLIGRIPVQVIGVVREPQGSAGTGLSVWLPYSTVQASLTGSFHAESVVARITEGMRVEPVEAEIVKVLMTRHGRKDFFTHNVDKYLKQAESTNQTLNQGLALVAAISLLVGGIGVMNMMLVSVAERTREIGIRMAVGARRADILRQFLIEAVIICLCGGMTGLALAASFAQVVSLVFGLGVIISLKSALAVGLLTCCTGLLCGFFPARHAAMLDPVVSLARD
jgi:macrolide transport system ATP-binding/permease protein